MKKENNFNKKTLVICAVLILSSLMMVLISLWLFVGEEKVKFEIVKEDKLPGEITSEIIPEYRNLERALACVAEDSIYVLVTRGEKPTTGYAVTVDKISIEEKDNKRNLIVYANFKDPDKDFAISQILTYPVAVVKTDLKKLPDSIELRIQY